MRHCSPSFHCGVDAYVKDGRIIKVEGIDGHPMNNGLLCTKGLSTGSMYTGRTGFLRPLKRVGARGTGKFEEITWDEAYRDHRGPALAIPGQGERGGRVLFFGGYSSGSARGLHRLAYSFGTENYATESSTCFHLGLMAWKVATGRPARPGHGALRGVFWDGPSTPTTPGI